jgi:hypothetical protein
MRFLRRYRFLLMFLALVIFCSAMVMRQFMANESKHVQLREAFILLWNNGSYRADAKRLHALLLRDLEELPTEDLKKDYERMLMLVDPKIRQPDNLLWHYHDSLHQELNKRHVSTLDLEQHSEAVLMRARKLAEEEK